MSKGLASQDALDQWFSMFLKLGRHAVVTPTRDIIFTAAL